MNKQIVKWVVLALLVSLCHDGMSQKFKQIGKFHDGLAIVQKYKSKQKPVRLYGYVNTKNKLVIPMQYSTAKNFNKGIAIVGRNHQFGLINKKGEAVLPIQYEEIGQLGFNKSYFVTKKDGLLGLAGPNGNEIYPTMFKDIIDMEDGRLGILVKENEEFGCYDFEHREELLPPRCIGSYEDSVVFCDGKYRFWGAYRADNRWYDTIISVRSFLRRNSYMFHPNGAYIVKMGDKFGLLRCAEKGELVEELPLEYDAIELEWKGDEGQNSLIHCKKDGKWGVFEEDGLTELVSDSKMEENAEIDGWVLFAQNQGKYGIYRPNHRIIFVYDEKPVKWGYKWLVKHDGKYGIENNDDIGYVELPTLYDTIMINAGDELLAITRKDDEVGMVYYNPYGKHCAGPFDWPYDDVQYCGSPSESETSSGVYAVSKDGKWGLVRIENEQDHVEVVEICKPQFDRIGSFDSNGELLVKKRNKTFYVDSNGKKMKRKIYFIKD